MSSELLFKSNLPTTAYTVLLSYFISNLLLCRLLLFLHFDPFILLYFPLTVRFLPFFLYPFLPAQSCFIPFCCTRWCCSPFSYCSIPFWCSTHRSIPFCSFLFHNIWLSPVSILFCRLLSYFHSEFFYVFCPVFFPFEMPPPPPPSPALPPPHLSCQLPTFTFLFPRFSWLNPC